MRKLSILAIIIISVILNGCSSPEKAQSDILKIKTTVYPIQFITEEIGGEYVDVDTIFPPGVSAHTYEPTAKDIIHTAESDVFIYLGGHMESFSTKMAATLKNHDTRLLPLKNVDNLFIKAGNKDDHHDHGEYDPHFWLSPTRMITAGEKILTSLTDEYPNHADYFLGNFAHFKEKMKTLDVQYTQALKQYNQKKILVAHAAFGYLEKDYGIEQIALQKSLSESIPSQKDIIHVIEEANTYDLRDMVFEQNTTNWIATIVKDNIKANAVTLHNLEVRTEENIANNENYIDIMQENLRVLSQILEKEDAE